ncbi:MAG: hypothetical protein ACRDKZ_09915 [Actinomycetota bacterium]
MHPLISEDLVREVRNDRLKRSERRRSLRRAQSHALRASFGVWLVEFGARLVEGADDDAALLLNAHDVRLAGPRR